MGVTRDKMAAQLRRAIQAVLDRGLHDPRIGGMVTVNRIDLSPDFANATVLVTVMPEDRRDLTLHGLRSAEAHVRSQVSLRAEFRRVPALHFRLDTVRRREADVLAAIARARAEDEARAGASPEIAPAGFVGGAAAEGDPDVLAAFDQFVDAAGDAAAAGPGMDQDDAASRGDAASGRWTNNGDRDQGRREDEAS